MQTSARVCPSSAGRSSPRSASRSQSERWRLDDAELTTDADERLVGAVEVLLGQRGGHLDADPRGALRYDRVAEAGDEDALLEQALREADRERGLADDDRHDRALARDRPEARGLQPLAERARQRVQPLDELRLAAQDGERLARRAGDRRRQRVREELRPRPLREHVADLL